MAEARAPRARVERSSVGVTAGVALGLVLGVFEPSCLERRTGDSGGDREARCATCHGDPTRSGDFVARSAPPRSLSGSEAVGTPGVGAHSIHLADSASHAAIACDECHEIPERADSPGHADSALPAEIVFGDAASQGDRAPSYDARARTCSNTYCHGDARAVWTEPRSSDAACGSCHGLPPPLPHPQSEACSACHADVIDAERNFVRPDRHVDGRVDFGAPSCSFCHGEGDEPAPPPDTLGNRDASAIGVGAHLAHLAGGESSRPLECRECHIVPGTVQEVGHVDGLPAELMFSGIALTDGHAPSWNRETASCSDSYCHGPGARSSQSPSWVESGPLACDGCHGAPPEPPHPQMEDCSICHAGVADGVLSIADRDRHVDGVLDVDVPASCSACHGGTSGGPPPDLLGRSGTSNPGVGAHAVHLAGTERSRAVPCEECHRVPETVLDPEHLDATLPAELRFSGAAVAFGAVPEYRDGTCQNSACHGAVFPDGNRSGGTNTAPRWTRVDGSEATCGSCHAIPPPAPHPYAEISPNCSGCHENLASDNVSFTRPDLHVDGVVTFTVP